MAAFDLTLVGIASGDPDQLTGAARRALVAADLVLIPRKGAEKAVLADLRRALCAHLGLEVNRLIRVSYGPFQLGEVPEGQVEEIRSRVLREQLGDKVIEKSGAQFDVPQKSSAADDDAPRESKPASWDPHADKNRLFGELKVTKNDGEICVGQIHVDDSVSHKPVAELYYNAAGDLKMGVQLCADNSCKQQRVDVDHVPKGQRFTYEIRYEKNVLSVSINGKAFQKLDTHKLNGPKSYFKAGNYNQKSGPTEVHFYQIKVSH